MRMLVVGLVLISFLNSVYAVSNEQDALKTDLNVVLALDVSQSISYHNENGVNEFRLQQDAIAESLQDPKFQKAILSCRNRVGLMLTQWGGSYGTAKNYTLLPWTLLKSQNDYAQAGQKISKFPRKSADDTHLSGAIEYARAQLVASPFTARENLILITSDGAHNSVERSENADGGTGSGYSSLEALAYLVRESRDKTKKDVKDINIAALVLEDGSTSFELGYPLVDYYQKNVITGDRGSAEYVENLEDLKQQFQQMMLTLACPLTS